MFYLALLKEYFTHRLEASVWLFGLDQSVNASIQTHINKHYVHLSATASLEIPKKAPKVLECAPKTQTSNFRPLKPVGPRPEQVSWSSYIRAQVRGKSRTMKLIRSTQLALLGLTDL